MRVRSLDIGGSGVKTALFEVHGKPYYDVQIIDSVEYLGQPSFSDFEDWVSQALPTDFDVLSISCPGRISGEEVLYSAIANWHNKQLVQDLQKVFPNSSIFLLNDAEAHLMAHVHQYDYPLMNITLGTSLGFAITNNLGQLYRSPTSQNFEVGDLILKTSASNPEVWYALGSQGLQELQTQRQDASTGAKQFGYRLGNFLLNISSIFTPANIVLSGGIVDSFSDILLSSIDEEFSVTGQRKKSLPVVYTSEYGRECALWGMANYPLCYRIHNELTLNSKGFFRETITTIS